MLAFWSVPRGLFQVPETYRWLRENSNSEPRIDAYGEIYESGTDPDDVSRITRNVGRLTRQQ
jgi:hypothetical protein